MLEKGKHGCTETFVVDRTYRDQGGDLIHVLKPHEDVEMRRFLAAADGTDCEVRVSSRKPVPFQENGITSVNQSGADSDSDSDSHGASLWVNRHGLPLLRSSCSKARFSPAREYGLLATSSRIDYPALAVASKRPSLVMPRSKRISSFPLQGAVIAMLPLPCSMDATTRPSTTESPSGPFQNTM